MPDWSYHPLKKLVLNKLSAKNSRAFIHHTMQMIATIPGGRHVIGFLGHMQPAPILSKTINNKVFASPIGLNSVIDPHMTGSRAFQELGFGFLEIGPVMLDKPVTQIAPVVRDERIHFSLQPEKLTLKDALHNLTKTQFKLPILVTLDEGISNQEAALIVQHLTPFVDAFIVTNEQLQQFTFVSARPYFVVQVAEDVQAIHPNANGVVLQAPRYFEDNDWTEAENAHETMRLATQSVKERNPKKTIITSGGIETPEQAVALIQAGADLCMLTEGYVNAGPGLPKRIHEKLLHNQNSSIENNPWQWSFLFGLSIFVAGFIALYFAFTTVILSYDEAFIGLKKEEITLVNPRILSFMMHDRMALAGTMIAAGIIYMQLARFGVRHGLHWAKEAFHSAAIAGFLGIFLFISFGYFDWLHGLFWLLLLPIYYLSWKEGKRVTRGPASHHATNDAAWKVGIYGQLFFVLLGFLLIIGGVVISTIGVSHVFITTDIAFLCMPAEMLQSISDGLIPVIAHDRAGFGSALISVGLLVLMLALWGYHAGKRWVWYTFAIGALPAFIAGLSTHFYIGYTTFIHLLPVYFLIVIYLLGLLFAYPFLMKKEQSISKNTS